MKLSASILFLVGAIASSSAFAPIGSPQTFVKSQSRNVARFMAEDPLPFFATADAKKEEPAPVVEEAAPAVDEAAPAVEMSLEDEVEMEVQKEIKKTKRVSNLRNADGVDYAPWMKMSEEDETKIRAIAKDRAEARRKRKEQETQVSGNLYLDSQAQELSGTGLNYKVLNGQVELEWGTKAEKDTKGFIVKRRAAKTNDFDTLASFEEWGPLVSKGADGGIYRYLDETSTPGGWVYRISECDVNGNEADLCQCLVEVQTEDEQRGAVIAAVGIAVLGIAAIAAGVLLDPMDGY